MMSQSYVKYLKSIQAIKKECLNAGMSEDEFKKLYFDILISLETEERTVLQRILDCVKAHKMLLLIIILALCSYYNFQYIYSKVVCNSQDYIYSGLKLLRKVFIPIISLFPSLTEYYHETCLIQNPFFTVVDMDCWPCSTINNIRNLEDPQPVTNQHTAPFVYKTDQKRITLDDVQYTYLRNYKHIETDTLMVLMNNDQYLLPLDLFNYQYQGLKNYYVWKFNKASEARVLREIIKRPKVVPKFGQSLERYLIIDSSQKSYRLPDTECSFAFFLALSGSRTIQLNPAEECEHQCKSLKVDLKESHLLWYNWWYWKPKVLPSTENSTFIGHLGSYCQL